MTRKIRKASGAIAMVLLALCFNNYSAHSQTDTVLVDTVISQTVPAQPPPADSVTTWKWQFLVEPYFMFSSMSGNVGVGTLPDAEIDKSSSDLFDQLDFGAMIYLEAASPRWALSSDFMYMRLKGQLEPHNSVESGSVEIEQIGWELALLRKLLPILEVGIGLQLNSIKTDMGVDLNAGTTSQFYEREIKESWVDPMIIARVRLPLFKRFLLQVRPSIGGFGVGSEVAWQIQADASFRLSKLLRISLGYRVISTDYENGEDDERFLYDIDTYGPVIRVGLNF